MKAVKEEHPYWDSLKLPSEDEMKKHSEKLSIRIHYIFLLQS